LRDLLTGVLATDDQSPRTRVATPLLSYLDAQAFTELAVSAPLLVFEPGENLVLEGQEGHTMYLICEGRVLVFATAGDGHRVYLSALTAGDFMGENSFFTGAPRSATVQAVTPVRAFELGREHYDRIVGTHQEAAMILMRFYKERIVETLLAKSPTLGLLPKEERTALVDHFTLSVFQPGATIIREGSRTRSIYLIKSGAASVYTEQDGERTAFSDIGPGTIFGEVAALRDIRRTATVAAKTEVEALELDGEVFAQALSRYPEVKSKIYAVGAERARANIDKIPGFGPNAKKS
jgi:cAMP-dependent protein kinase regulator